MRITRDRKVISGLVFIVLMMILITGCQTIRKIDTESGGYPPQSLTVPDSLSFMDMDYKLAWRKDAGQLLYLEYLPDGQNLDTWTNMITVQISGISRSEAMNDYIVRTQKYRVEDVRVYENKQQDETVFDALLFDQENDWIEHNLVKFSKRSGLPVVLAYVQSRIRLSAALKDKTVMDSTTKGPRMARLAALGKLDFYSLANIR